MQKDYIAIDTFEYKLIFQGRSGRTQQTDNWFPLRRGGMRAE